jgi:hypothetical protein
VADKSIFDDDSFLQVVVAGDWPSSASEDSDRSSIEDLLKEVKYGSKGLEEAIKQVLAVKNIQENQTVLELFARVALQYTGGHSSLKEVVDLMLDYRGFGFQGN